MLGRIIIVIGITSIFLQHVSSYVPQVPLGSKPCKSSSGRIRHQTLSKFSIGKNYWHHQQPYSYRFSTSFLPATEVVNDEEGEIKEEEEKKSTLPKMIVNKETLAFNNKLNQLSQSFDKKSAPKVQELLYQTMDDVINGSETKVQPNVVSFTAAINAWARSTDKRAAHHAESVLKKMHNLCTTYPEITPNAYAYNAAITAWTRSRERGAAKRAEKLLNQMWNYYEETGDENVKPDACAFNTVVNAAARSREPKCADWAASILERMEHLYNAGHKEMQPDALTFGAIINAYANSGEEDASDRAAQLLQHMESLYQFGYEGVKPNTFVYNSCMNALAKSGKKGSGERAEHFLKIMEQMYEEQGEDGGVKPDVISYSTVINAHANGGGEDAGQRADVFLKKMEQLYIKGDNAAKPNAIAYTAAIKAWISTGKRRESNKETANEEEDYLKTIATRAEELMMRMCLQYLAGDRSMKPSKVTFDLVSEALRGVNDQEGIKQLDIIRKRIEGWTPQSSRTKRGAW